MSSIETLVSVICLMERRLKELRTEQPLSSSQTGSGPLLQRTGSNDQRAAVLSFYQDAMDAAQSDLLLMRH
jgi:hypothetical protein